MKVKIKFVNLAPILFTVLMTGRSFADPDTKTIVDKDGSLANHYSPTDQAKCSQGFSDLLQNIENEKVKQMNVFRSSALSSLAIKAGSEATYMISQGIETAGEITALRKLRTAYQAAATSPKDLQKMVSILDGNAGGSAESLEAFLNGTGANTIKNSNLKELMKARETYISGQSEAYIGTQREVAAQKMAESISKADALSAARAKEIGAGADETRNLMIEYRKAVSGKWDSLKGLVGNKEFVSNVANADAKLLIAERSQIEDAIKKGAGQAIKHLKSTTLAEKSLVTQAALLGDASSSSAYNDIFKVMAKEDSKFAELLKVRSDYLSGGLLNSKLNTFDEMASSLYIDGSRSAGDLALSKLYDHNTEIFTKGLDSLYAFASKNAAKYGVKPEVLRQFLFEKNPTQLLEISKTIVNPKTFSMAEKSIEEFGILATAPTIGAESMSTVGKTFIANGGVENAATKMRLGRTLGDSLKVLGKAIGVVGNASMVWSTITASGSDCPESRDILNSTCESLKKDPSLLLNPTGFPSITFQGGRGKYNQSTCKTVTGPAEGMNSFCSLMLKRPDCYQVAVNKLMTKEIPISFAQKVMQTDYINPCDGGGNNESVIGGNVRMDLDGTKITQFVLKEGLPKIVTDLYPKIADCATMAPITFGAKAYQGKSKNTSDETNGSDGNRTPAQNQNSHSTNVK